MATTLSRRIRRIGILRSTTDESGKTTHNLDPAVTPEARESIAATLRKQAKVKRQMRKVKA